MENIPIQPSRKSNSQDVRERMIAILENRKKFTSDLKKSIKGNHLFKKAKFY